MRGRRLLLNHTVQCGGSNQFSMMDGSPPLTTTPSPALAEAAARSNPHRRTPPSRSPRVPSSEAFGRRPHDRWIDHDGPASETLVWTAPASQGFLQLGRVWSIAVMCPALVCGCVDRGPRWVTRIGPRTSRRGLCPKGFPGVFRSSVRPIAILLLSLQAPGQNEVSRLRPEAAGDRPRRSPSWPRASEPSCWPARLPQASSACALAD